MQLILRKKPTISGALAWGTILIFAVFQAIAYPLFIVKASFMTLFYGFTMVMVALLAIAAYQMIRRRRLAGYGTCVRKVVSAVRTSPWLFALAAVAIPVYMFTVLKAYGNSDDSYYLGRVMEILARNQLAVSHSVGWFGFDVPGFPVPADASTLEFLKAYLTFVSGIPAVRICRVCLNGLLSVVHYAAVFTLLDSVMEQDGADGTDRIRRKVWILVIYLVFQALSMRGNSVGVWMTRFIWQGKSILPAVIFPMLYTACADLIRTIRQARFTDWFAVSCVLVAGVSVSIVGVFLPVILYFCLGIAFLIHDRFRSVKKIIVPAVLSAVPIAVFAAGCLMVISTKNVSYFSGTVTCTWLGSAQECMDAFQVILYVLSVIYVAKKGSSLQKTLFVLGPLVLMATFLNPLLIDLVSTYVTTASVYFRLFWLLPVFFLPAFAAADIIEALQVSRKRFLLIASLVGSLCLCGFALDSLFISHNKPVFPIAFFCKATNPHYLPDYVVEFGNAIIEDWEGEEPAKVVHVAEDAYQFRQYSVEYQMLAGYRDDQRQRQRELIPGTTVEKGQFYETMGQVDDADYLHDMLTRLGADYYISTYTDALTPEEIEAAGLTFVKRADRHTYDFGDEWYILWRV